MSSILKALRKIDESSQPANNGQPWPHPAEARDAITKSIQRRWFIRRMTTYGLVAACVISLTVLLYLRQADKTPQHQATAPRTDGKSEQGQIHRAKIEKAAPGQRQSETTMKKRPPPPPTTAPRKITPSRKNAAPAVRPASKVPPAAIPADPASPTQSKKPLPKKSKKAATRVVPPPGDTTARQTSQKPVAGKPSAASRSSRSPQYSRLQNGGLALQAIAWAAEPAKRIAVINGSIVREGETVEGFTLMRIRKDDIVLNDGTKTWQLEFGLKR